LGAAGIGKVLRANRGVGERVCVDKDVVDDLADTVAQDVSGLPIIDSQGVHDFRCGDLNLPAYGYLADGNESTLRLVSLELLAHLKTNRFEEVHALEEFVALGQDNTAASAVPPPIVIQVGRKNREWQSLYPSQRAHS